jgi:hypothetical protein
MKTIFSEKRYFFFKKQCYDLFCLNSYDLSQNLPFYPNFTAILKKISVKKNWPQAFLMNLFDGVT